MANQRDINRWKKGKDHWNKWAEGRLKAKEKLEREGKWEVDEGGRGSNEETKRWIASSSIDFSEWVFEEKADFSDLAFPHVVSFSQSRFKSGADFQRVKFLKYAWFVEVEFEEDVNFTRSKFVDITSFRKGIFSKGAKFEKCQFFQSCNLRKSAFLGDVDFNDAIFMANANFNQCNFASRTNCNRASFDKLASFRASNIEGPLYLQCAEFCEVPDFTQTNLKLPVRIDNVNIPSARAFTLKGDVDRAARYRALKRIASLAHDHVQEMTFFASEAKERRGLENETVLSGRWFLSLLYELFSNFGRSVIRPIGGLVLIGAIFASIFALSSPSVAWYNCGPDNWAPITKSIQLSAINSVPFVGLGKHPHIQQISNCLYGTEILPFKIVSLTGFQTVLSSILIFLFLLAVRNHFRIK